jgi:hypothetical protein
VRWRFFTLHFQFMVAPDHPGHYDFYRCLAGPAPLKRLLKTRFAIQPAARLSAMATVAAAKDATAGSDEAAPAGETPGAAEADSSTPEAGGTPSAVGAAGAAAASAPSDRPVAPVPSQAPPAGALEKHPA